MNAPPATGRLTAVLFADIVGYSSLAARDAPAAHTRLEAFERAARSAVTAQHGRVVKFVGDEVLAEFPSASAALRAAFALCGAFGRVGNEGSAPPELRAAVHIGEVLERDGDLFGDGINTASRLEHLAEPGCVLVSEDVWRQLRNQPAFVFESLGEHKLRGLATPVLLFRARPAADAVLHEGTAPRVGRRPQRRRLAPRSLLTRRHRLSVPRWVPLASLGVIGVAAVLVFSASDPATAFPARGWVVIAALENRTGDPVFDDALSEALAISLEQSTYLNVMPRDRVRDALRRMRRPDARLTPELAHEVAVREGAHLVVLPSIAGIGDRYTLALRVEQPGSRERLRTLSAQAGGTGEILSAIDQIASALRSYLGEAPADLERQNVPLFQATTASLAALRALSLARNEHAHGRFGEALEQYRLAVQLDTTFNIAHSALGMLLFEWAGQPDSGRIHVQQSLRGADDLTEREQLNVRMIAALVLDRDPEAAAAFPRAQVALYPDAYGALNNLGRIAWFRGRPDEAAGFYRRALEVYPRFDLAYDGLLYMYLYALGEVDSALVWSHRQVEHDARRVDAWNNLGWAALGTDSLEEAARAFQRALAIDPEYVSQYGAEAASATLVRYRLAYAYRLMGRTADAERTLLELLRRDSTQTEAHYDLGMVYAVAGNTTRAHAAFERFLAITRRRQEAEPSALQEFAMARALARLGRSAEAERARQRGLAADSTLHFHDGLALAALGRNDEALAAFDRAITGGFRNYVWLYVHPDAHALREQPEFRARLGRLLHRPELEQRGSARGQVQS